MLLHLLEILHNAIKALNTFLIDWADTYLKINADAKTFGDFVPGTKKRPESKYVACTILTAIYLQSRYYYAYIYIYATNTG